MWLSEKAIERIRDLEGQLRDSVARVVYDAALARIDVEREAAKTREAALVLRIAALEQHNTDERLEHARQMRWYVGMLARRAGSFPAPPSPQEKALEAQQRAAEPPQISESNRVKAQVVIEAGLADGRPQTEITEAVQSLKMGFTEAEIAAAISASRNGHG